MHIKFHYVKFKNLMSYGNVETSVVLDQHKHTIFTAKNGMGKCVHPSTEIEIMFDDPKIEEKFKDFLT